MPKQLERRLIAEAHKRGLTKSNPKTRRRFGAYVYGTVARLEKGKGKRKKGKR